MDCRAILQKIIDNNGSCEWIKEYGTPADPNYICSLCPMSKLKKRADGSWMNCGDALGAMFNGHWMEDQTNRKLYVDKARQLLVDLHVEDMLTEGDECVNRQAEGSSGGDSPE